MTRIYTEDIHRARIQRILDKHFTGYTIIPTLGRWQGKNERSLMVEIDGAKLADVRRAAEEIKRANHQQAVLIARDAHERTQLV